MLFCSNCGFGQKLESYAAPFTYCACGCNYWQTEKPKNALKQRRPCSLDVLSDPREVQHEQLDYLIGHCCAERECRICARRDIVSDALLMIFG